MKKILIILSSLAVLGCGSSQTQPVDATKAAQTIADTTKATVTEVNENNFTGVEQVITPQEVEEYLSFLASDDLKGRATGSPGIAKAADYIQNQLKNNGIRPFFDEYRDDFKVESLDAFNVVGVVEGTDPKLKNEYILLGAHYDHIGIIKTENGDSIANGANDDTSGTVAILEIAKYFAKSKPKRSIIFALFSGEEMGLLGSKHLAQRLKEQNVNLYTMLEVEMIGVPMVNKDHLAYLTGYEMSNMASVFNTYCGEKVLGFLPQAQEYKLFYRSDNASFYNALKIPAQTVSTFDFTNFDYYHKVGDEIDKLDIDHIANLINNLIPGVAGMANSETHSITMNGN